MQKLVYPFSEGDKEQKDLLGALNLYARAPRAFDEDSEHFGLLFASHAAVAFAGVAKHDQLTAAMATRDLIGQAKESCRPASTADRAACPSSERRSPRRLESPQKSQVV